jgi:hypothetical protein
MMSSRRLASSASLALPLALAGCSLFPTTRKLPVPKAPSVVQTVTPQQLVAQLNQRWDAVQSLTATVEIQATELKTKEGLEKEFPSFRGYILMRKPRTLRVMGQYFGIRVFDMVSDGQNFTMEIPSKNVAFEGSSTEKGKSPNPLENLRPEFFLDAIMVRGLNADEEYLTTTDTVTVQDAEKKHLYSIPEYILEVVRRKPGSRELTLVRKVTFHRDDLLPYEQEIFDSDGNPETQVSYDTYAEFASGEYPSKVTIKRPQEGVELTLSVARVDENMKLPPDQFQLQLPKDIKIEKLQ